MQVSRRVEAVAWVLSLALHASLAAYIFWSTTAPDLGFEFELPMEVEFGLTEAVTVSAGASAPTPPQEPAETAEDGEGEGAVLDGGVPQDAGPPDAGPPRRRRDAGPPEGVAEADEGEGTGDQAGEGRGVAFLPAGAQIALRLDVERIRRSPLGPDVRALLAAMPDWQALLEGSEIDPLQDLDRLLVATPNLQRSRLIVAGRVTADADAIRAAAERLAAGAGQPLTWRTESGVEVARWYNHDDTERVVAIIGPRHFVLCRPEDLPRVMAVARNRAAEEDDEGAPTEHPADALLSMGEGEGLSLEVEGARQFAQARGRTRGPIEMVPTEIRLALSELPADAIAARSRWTYEDADRAGTAAGYWDGMREAYGHNVITAVLGIAPILQRATIEAEDDHFQGNVDLQVAEMRRLLALTRGFFEDRARAQQRAANPPPSPGPEPTLPENPYE
ncbi:MAG: hypothetical protein H6719_04055 [Sandaracinaceae bacterium]|nr:hypothetical protein [Sandaracinaceae bacterium]